MIRPGVLHVMFADGATGEIDVLARMRGPVFEDARTPEGFAQAEVDRETGTVVWRGHAELAPNTLSSGRRAACGRTRTSRRSLRAALGEPVMKVTAALVLSREAAVFELVRTTSSRSRPVRIQRAHTAHDAALAVDALAEDRCEVRGNYQPKVKNPMIEIASARSAAA